MLDSWQRVFDAIESAVAIIKPSGEVVECNRAMCSFLGQLHSDIIGLPCFLLFHHTNIRISNCPVERMLRTQKRETSLLKANSKWFEITADPLMDSEGKIQAAIHIVNDVTARQQASMEREQLLSQLQSSERKRIPFSGLLPICSRCKRIRSEEDRWDPIDDYIRKNSDADFTHSICPDCLTFLYPDIAEDVLNHTRHITSLAPSPASDETPVHCPNLTV